MITDAGLALASWVLCILVLVLTLLAVAHWHARPVVIVEDPPPRLGYLENEQLEGEEPVLDLPVDRADLPQVPDGMVLYFGGAVHPDCAARWLRFDLRPIDGCAVWLTDSLKETVT